MNSKTKVLLNKKVSQVSDACPTAICDIKENVKNRNWTIDNFAYGPLNPDHPDPGFWECKAEMWHTDVDTAQTARCCNCAAFDQSPKIMDCIIQGINEHSAADPRAVEDLALTLVNRLELSMSIITGTFCASYTMNAFCII